MITAMDTQPAVLFSEEKAGRFAIGYVPLENPRAFNALDLEILQGIEEKLAQWRKNGASRAWLSAPSPTKPSSRRRRCEVAGHGLQRDGSIAAARGYFTTEYFVDYLIHVYRAVHAILTGTTAQL